MVCVCVCVERNRTGNEPEGVGSDQVIREDPAGAVVGERFLLPCLAAGYTKEALAAGTCVVGPSLWRETR